MRPAIGASPALTEEISLYANGDTGVLVIDAKALTLSGRFLAGRAVRELALSRDGTRLYALTDEGIVILDAATGRAIGTLGGTRGALGGLLAIG